MYIKIRTKEECQKYYPWKPFLGTFITFKSRVAWVALNDQYVTTGLEPLLEFFKIRAIGTNPKLWRKITILSKSIKVEYPNLAFYFNLNEKNINILKRES